MKIRQNASTTNQLTRTEAATPKPRAISSPAPRRLGPSGQSQGGRPAAAIRGPGKQSSPEENSALIKARIDVGWGNALFIRGQGCGLRWDKGQPLICADGSTWVWANGQVREKVEFKLLLNDQVWSDGPNLVVEPGRRIEVTPSFTGHAGVRA
jgi:hypothetical protein